jgi:hypothetical protein
MRYWFNLLIAFDQVVNTIFNGDPDETISARSWRLRARFPFNILHLLIDRLFFLEDNHCYKSYLAETNRKQLAEEYRTK